MNWVKSQSQARVLAFSFFILSLFTLYTGYFIVKSVDFRLKGTVTAVTFYIGSSRGHPDKVTFSYEFDGIKYTNIDNLYPLPQGVKSYERGDSIDIYISRRYPAVSYTRMPDLSLWYFFGGFCMVMALFLYIADRQQ